MVLGQRHYRKCRSVPRNPETRHVPPARPWPSYCATVKDNVLGHFLRTRRGRLRPLDVGLPEHGHRRVPGLRREEVALLAGISADYYLRLEQGRGGQPSEQVLRALAHAFRLDLAGTDYLLGLVSPRPAAALDPDAREQPPPSSVNLLRVLDLPAFITGRNFDVLAANAAAFTLSPELVVGRNRLRSLFLVESERALYRDWDSTTERFVALVRDVVGRNAADPTFERLLDQLMHRSSRFRTLWSRHDVTIRDTEMASFVHPVAGDLRLHLERLDLPGVTRQSMVIYHPEVGSPDAVRLEALLNSTR